MGADFVDTLGFSLRLKQFPSFCLVRIPKRNLHWHLIYCFDNPQISLFFNTFISVEFKVLQKNKNKNKKNHDFDREFYVGKRVTQNWVPLEISKVAAYDSGSLLLRYVISVYYCITWECPGNLPLNFSANS
jgi:hypothetical protein